MKKITVFVMFLLVLPFISDAQVSDGSGTASTTRRDWLRGWRNESSELQIKINALSNIVVTTLPQPILFGVTPQNIYPNFGDPRDGGARTHEGEDMMGVKGTPIVSPTQSVVIKTGTGSSEGLYVYTANPGGETFVYMHLDKIGEGVIPGKILEVGSLIGYVGNTGNASGGAAHLHFEIHDSNRNAIDPFPRLTKEFTIEEKISFLTKIVAESSDANALSNLLVSNFRSALNSAVSKSIALPPQIVSAMGNAVVVNATNGSTPTPVLPSGDLTVGSRGELVTNLQNYLIVKKAGAEAVKLATAGATGYFGPVTQAALREYQLAMNISPADGYYGSTTRVTITSIPTVTPTPVNQIPAGGVSKTILSRNLYKGLVGEDVRILQKFLNSHGYIVATNGAGSIGNESTYFGSATQAAVIKFQIATYIHPSLGYVGVVTRGIIASL